MPSAVILAQVLVTLVTAAGFALGAPMAEPLSSSWLSALAGGAIGVAASLVQASAVFGTAASVEAFYRNTLRMEVRKWVLIACLFAAVFGVWRTSQPAPLLVAFTLSQLCYLLVGFAQPSRRAPTRRALSADRTTERTRTTDGSART